MDLTKKYYADSLVVSLVVYRLQILRLFELSMAAVCLGKLLLELITHLGQAVVCSLDVVSTGDDIVQSARRAFLKGCDL